MELERRYRAIRTLGHGGMGGVTLVEDRLRPGVPLALKRLDVGLSQRFASSFFREFAVLAGLSMPGLCPVYDFGLYEGASGEPVPFLTRSFVDGQTLDVAVTALDFSARLRLLAELSHLVAQLHQRGVVHGDIKPRNVVVDEAGHPFLIDFGLADGAALGAERYRPPAGSGTPAFMAPELLKGGQAHRLSDIYALGATCKAVLPEDMRSSAGAVGARVDGALEASTHPDPAHRLPAARELAVALGGHGAEGRAFYPPRPRGHETLLDELEHELLAASPVDDEDVAPVLGLYGPQGAGKSTLLRALRFRFQLRGFRVIECQGATGGPVGVRHSLAVQLAMQLGEARDADGGASVSELLSQASRLCRERPVLLLVDDAEELDDGALELVRALTALEGEGRLISVVASSQRTDRGQGLATHLRPVPPLDRDAVATLAEDVLGPSEDALIDLIVRRSEGRPGAVIDAIHCIAEAGAVSEQEASTLVWANDRAGHVARTLRAMSEAAAQAVRALALLGGQVPATAVSVLGPKGALSSAATSGLVRLTAHEIRLADQGVTDAVLEATNEAARRGLAETLRARTELDAVSRCWAHLHAGAWAEARQLFESVRVSLEAAGALREAYRLATAFIAAGQWSREDKAQLQMVAAQLGHGVGDYARARSWAMRAAAEDEAHADASRVLRARIAVSMGELDDAEAQLASVSETSPADTLKSARLELSKAKLRRGEYETAKRLAVAASESGTGGFFAECASMAGLSCSYLGDEAGARAWFAKGLEAASAGGALREESLLRTSMAIERQRSGDYNSARQLYERALSLAETVGDMGSMATCRMNLAVILQAQGNFGVAVEHYERAAKLAHRAGRVSTAVGARVNQAGLLAWLGMRTSALELASTALRDATRAGLLPVAAQAVGVHGDAEAMAGHTEEALTQYSDAIARYRALGQPREVAERLLDAAETLLDREGAGDVSAAVSRIAEARETLKLKGDATLQHRATLLAIRARLSNGDVERSADDLLALHAEVSEPTWFVAEMEAVLGRVRRAAGAEFVARRHSIRAAELLEDLASRLPRHFRESFWSDVRRQRIRAEALASQAVGGGAEGEGSQSSSSASKLEARVSRLLLLIKELACEHELDRLLERITQSAVELTGAERGLLLLVTEAGALEPHAVKQRTVAADDPVAGFSRSIAEAVLIDGEPIVSIDAQADGRLREYMSVHKLMLRSVACVPVRGRSGIVGVLYLEHRGRVGRFDDGSFDLLFAFADQAAIAVENARLVQSLEAERRAVKASHQAVLEAKREMERVLEARTEELSQLRDELHRTHDSHHGDYAHHGIVGQSAPMRRLFAMMDRVRDAAVPVVIHGESGTGKELVARAIHRAGARASKPFVALNCAAIPEALLESELFGHVRGAFTGAERSRQGVLARAHGGTLFLDEIGDMPSKMQVDLLRVLQDGRVTPVGADESIAVDVRIVAASNKALRALVEAGQFREDLYYRLNVVELTLPPLRARMEDLPLLVEHFLSGLAKSHGRRKGLTREALTLLSQHVFPGNVRELEHVLTSAWVMSDSEVIKPADLVAATGSLGLVQLADAHGLSPDSAPPPSELLSAAAPAQETASAPPATPPGAALPSNVGEHKDQEKQAILEALEAHGWNRAAAAKALGMPRRTFYRRLKSYDILA